MLIQALTDIENQNELDKDWDRLRLQIIEDFKIHEYTIFYWSCFEASIYDCWKVTSYMRNLWVQIKEERNV